MLGNGWAKPLKKGPQSTYINLIFMFLNTICQSDTTLAKNVELLNFW